MWVILDECRYDAAGKLFTATSSLADELKGKAEAGNTACSLNTAACHLKLREFNQVRSDLNVELSQRRASACIRH